MALTTTRFITSLRYATLFLHVLLFSIPTPCHSSGNGCLNEGSRIVDRTESTPLISSGSVFELGFFTLDHNFSQRRYLGIWYSSNTSTNRIPKTVVWVANRDKPLLETNGSLIIDDGNAKLLDSKGKVYWSTNYIHPEAQPIGTAQSGSGYGSKNYTLIGSKNRRVENWTVPFNSSGLNRTTVRNFVTLCLEDSGNLKLRRRERDQILWQSFDNPTDTFLPGMYAAGGGFNLTSWLASDNPALGRYVFSLKLEDNRNSLVINLRSPAAAAAAAAAHYWLSELTPFDKIPRALLSLLLNNASQLGDYNYKNTRLVMSFSGQIQFWKKTENRGGSWSLIWSEPKDQCSLFEVCGGLASCDSNSGLLCTCLPGSSPNSPEKWDLGDYSQGCSLKSEPCRRKYTDDVFVKMPMMKTKAPKTNQTVEDCEGLCLEDCTCLAYSCGVHDCSKFDSSNEKMCLTWSSSELADLQEDYPGGNTIFIRTMRSEIESTSRACQSCGIYIIPYPLSTAANCGDPSYFNFICNKTTGQLYFAMRNHTYNVTSLDPDTKNFTIQTGYGKSCGSTYTDLSKLAMNYSLPYKFRNCKVVLPNKSFIEIEQSFIEVEISWNPPEEPTCKAPSDCHDWQHTSCKSVGSGKMRCRCSSKFHWDGNKLKCTKVNFLRVLIPCVIGALAISISCGLYIIYRTRKRRRDELQSSVEFKEDEIEGIDVAFYNWESILGATNNFADTNKLGTGGFGSVYKGELPNGQEFAVKRLSRVSVQGIEEFRTEVKLIARLQHRNLVRLIGYCTKGDEKILVYEYMPNGSLDSCLFDENHSVYLDWNKRFDIILGIARGLLYLHQDSRLRIIHRDLKPSNILLDVELNPKISDFGIARIVGGMDTQASTGRIVGTHGYMSPEYAYEGIFSVKSDVFSFGVVILETISGRRNSKIFLLEHGISLLGIAWKLCNEDKGLELMDPKLKESCNPSEVLKCIHIGLLCIQEDPSDRPTMSTVVLMLSGENVSLPLAKQPAFMNRRPLSETTSSSSAKDSSIHELITASTVGR